MAQPVAIVGAGIAGLSAAFELRRQGHDVEVFEASERPGGVLDTTTLDGYVLEWAANGFIPEPSGAVELATALGLPCVEAQAAARNRWVFVDGRLQAVPTRPGDLLRSELVPWRAKLGLIAEPFRWAVLDREESVDEFARRRLGSEVARVLVAPFVTGVFAGDSERLSLRAAFPAVYELERRGGLIRGGVAKAIENLMAGQRSSRRMLAPRNGMGSLGIELARLLGPKLHLQTQVTDIRSSNEGPILVWNGGERRFSAAVLAVPAPAAARICERSLPGVSKDLLGIEHAPVVVAQLGFARANVAHHLDGFGFLVAKNENLRILGCVFESVIWPGRAPAGHVLLRCFLGGTRDPGILSCDDEAIADQCVRDLERVLGSVGQPAMAQVRRHVPGIAQYTFGHLDRVANLQTAARAARVVVAGSSFHGVSVNQCVSRAKLAQILNGLLAVLVFWACDGGCAGQQPMASDGAQPGHDAVPAPLSQPTTTTLAVTPQWLWPPAVLRLSGPRNACGTRQPAPVSVDVMGGVHDTVAILRGLAFPEAAPPPPKVVIGPCGIEPRVTVARLGGEVELIAMATGPVDVVLSRDVWRQRVPFRVPGQRFVLPVQETGVIAIAPNGDAASLGYIYVSEFTAQVTDARGEASFSEVPLGPREVAIWHAPVAQMVSSTTHTINIDKTPRHSVAVSLLGDQVLRLD